MKLIYENDMEDRAMDQVLAQIDRGVDEVAACDNVLSRTEEG